MPVRPMFPLGSVLLPGMVLPLHVFEPRYRALVRDCLDGEREFGVTLIERGSEVGGGDLRAMAGTIAEIVRADELDDGRWALVAVGTRRVTVRQWLDDDPYPRADVEDWPDDLPSDEAALRAEYHDQVALLRRVVAMAVELGSEGSATVELTDDPALGSYQIAILAPVGALDRHRLLTAAGPEDRLARSREMLEDQALMLEAQLSDPEGMGPPP